MRAEFEQNVPKASRSGLIGHIVQQLKALNLSQDAVPRLYAVDRRARNFPSTEAEFQAHAFVMGWPGKDTVLASLRRGGKLDVGTIQNVELLGHKGKLKWAQDESGLKVDLPEEKPSEHVVTLKVALA